MEKNQINIRKVDEQHIAFSFDEETTIEDVFQLLGLMKQSKKVQCEGACSTNPEKKFKSELEQRVVKIADSIARANTDYLKQPVFNEYQNETKMMRYLKLLENKDLALNRCMIPLGSCTMKLNAASEMVSAPLCPARRCPARCALPRPARKSECPASPERARADLLSLRCVVALQMPITFPGFSRVHPFVPESQSQGYRKMLNSVMDWLKIITKFDAVSLQPNSGATGEYSGLLAIRRYHESRNEKNRNICLIPASAHGTNPASAILAGMKTVTIKVKAKTGEIDLVDLENQAKKHQKNLAAVMITYPSTYGIYEETVVNAIKIVHKYGGQVYMDGANMNAQVGFTSPGYLGADVCHLNLHKTFAIPHGGGGPGIGPICVKKHLAKFLPSHKVVDIGGCSLVNIAAGPWSSASIVTITYQYIAQLGKPGLQLSTLYALLNANYLMNLLKDKYKVVYRGINGRCAHEFIIDIKPFKVKHGSASHTPFNVPRPPLLRQQQRAPAKIQPLPPEPRA